MRQIILTLSIATFGGAVLTATPVLAAPPLVCGVREETPAMTKAQSLAKEQEAKAEPVKAPEPDPSGKSGFREPNDRLFLVSLDDKLKCSATTDGRCKWAVVKPFTYQPRGTQDLITVPPGFTTDLASIPSAAWPFLPADGPWLKGAVVHDFLYKTCGRGQWQHMPYGFTRKGCTPDKECYSRKEADGIFRDAMEDRGVGSFKRGLIHSAVRWFGGGGWGH
ncbi:MAG: DUF1353 domain-containing protein [Phenylobacterium sp.]